MVTNSQDQADRTSTGTATGSTGGAMGSTGGAMGSLKDTLGNNQMVNKATQFAKQRPWASAALAGVVGVALLNTLRGR